jgi:hypothetical protein
MKPEKGKVAVEVKLEARRSCFVRFKGKSHLHSMSIFLLNCSLKVVVL